MSALCDLDVVFAKFLKHGRLDGRSLFEGFETLRAVTYSIIARAFTARI
jgi:hypothetical protein